jgi:DNA topoisomerase IA
LEKYTLIITEKPDAASRIATALDENGKPKKTVSQRRTILPSILESGNIVVVPALGHLYTITANKKANLPRFRLSMGSKVSG